MFLKGFTYTAVLCSFNQKKFSIIKKLWKTIYDLKDSKIV